MNLVTYPSCESSVGHVAELKARQKNVDHPVFDFASRKRFHLRAISFGRHGYLAAEIVGFIKQLAYGRALALGLEPSAKIRRWYGVISCCIQRANAKILRNEPIAGRHSPTPPRLIARGRDLALVGA